MRGASDDILDDTYEYTKAGLETVPTPSLEIIKTALDILSYQYPQAKQTDPNLITDPSYVKKIEQSGFITRRYTKNERPRKKVFAIETFSESEAYIC